MLALLFYFLMVTHRAACQHPVKCLLEVYEDMVQVLLVLQISLTQDLKVKDLFRDAPSCSEPSLFLCEDLFCLALKSVV